MPILRGAVTFARFRVEHRDRPPADVRRWLLKGLKSQAFEPLDKKGDEDRACGFVELENHDAIDFHVGQLFYGERALFAWRVDQLKVPANQVRDELERWMRAFEQREGRKPARSEKSEQRGAIRHQLRVRALPLMRLHDLSWNLKTQKLQVWSASRKVVDEVVAAVESAFEVRLIAASPGALATHEGVAENALSPTPSLVGGDELAGHLEGGTHGEA